jgi:hypothetical protein
VDYDNPEVEEQWCSERRSDVLDYLQQQRLVHGQVGEWPAWHLAPYVSIWAIESATNRGSVGWWAIAGDLPTDYVSAASIKHPRNAMQAISARWHSAAVDMAQGNAAQAISIGKPSDWQLLAPQLASRANLLQSWAADAAVWSNL